MGVKLLFTIAAIFLIYQLLKLFNRMKTGDSEKPAEKPEVNAVQCKHCGVYLPKAEAVAHGADFFCSSKHLEAERSSHGDE